MLEQFTMELVDQHARSWMMALHYYENGSKILCQMLVSLTDDLLQRGTGQSVLYPTGKPSAALSLADELAGLRLEYLDCFRFLSVFDFAVEKMGESIKVPEYGKLVKQHIRIQENGLPAKVEAAAQMAGVVLPTVTVEVDPALLEGCWDELLQQQGQLRLLSDFTAAVVSLDRLAEQKLKN